MEVRLTLWAENCLKEIYHHYLEEADTETAAEIINKILDRAESLVNYPERGRT